MYENLKKFGQKLEVLKYNSKFSIYTCGLVHGYLHNMQDKGKKNLTNMDLFIPQISHGYLIYERLDFIILSLINVDPSIEENSRDCLVRDKISGPNFFSSIMNLLESLWEYRPIRIVQLNDWNNGITVQGFWGNFRRKLEENYWNYIDNTG
jgi:hypothetical protein